VSERVLLSAEPLSLDRALMAIVGPDAGAIVTFLGLVRDFNDGHAVTLLEYEAFETMALSEMKRIVAALEREIPGVRVVVHHRQGALGVGDLAVICAASAPHRGEAFRACRAAIDRVKETVPIWKREHGPEGPYWVGWQDARCQGDEHDPSHEHGQEHGH
jgi:molybdopterin synthase catalytic subunit